jgi:uncharacterized protein DUF1569
MTTQRRTLQFASLDEVMPEVDRLRQGHTTVGTWSLAQICRHLATVLRRVVDLPASTPHDPSQELGEERKREVLETGRIPEGLPAPQVVSPEGQLDEDVEAENLRQAIAYFQASPGPVAPHRFFGPLTRDEWHRLQCVHCAHHLSFAIPGQLSPQA